MLPPPRAVHRWWLLGGGALLGLAAAFLTPGSAGCIYHDTCIKVTSPGHDSCSNLALAKQWPAGGSFDLDSARQAYARLGDATALEVRIKRGSQWLDFTYNFVR